MYVCMYVCMYACMMYECMYVCRYVCMYMYVLMYVCQNREHIKGFVFYFPFRSTYVKMTDLKCNS